jgi:hypothetical protein
MSQQLNLALAIAFLILAAGFFLKGATLMGAAQLSFSIAHFIRTRRLKKGLAEAVATIAISAAVAFFMLMLVR